MADIPELFTPEQLVELELDLIGMMRAQGMHIEEIKLIGLKGAGDSSTVFTIMIDGVHHVLKVYRSDAAFNREIKHLRRQIPPDRFLFVWPAKDNRFNYSIVVIEVPDGLQLHERMLTPIVGERLADCLIKLHSLQYKQHITIPKIIRYLDEAKPWATEHGELFPELGGARVADVIDAGKAYVKRNAKLFRVPKSRTHNDLWWANVIVAEEDVYLIDWENLGRDDYCKDLAFFRIMVNYERTAAPVSMWEDDVDNLLIDTFMQPILERYVECFEDETFWQRYGLYALQQASLNFARALYGDRRGARRAGYIMKTGIRLFEDYCLATEHK